MATNPLPRLRARLALARWLGPWTPGTQVPPGIARTELQAPGVRAWCYRPEGRPPQGALLVAHGLHYLGPTDPRFDRFCRVLSSAGLTVLVPFLPPYMALRPDPSIFETFAAGLRLLKAQPGVPARPGVFSISFGSLPALRLAASPEHRDQLGGLVVFGGYADWDATARYILDGSVAGLVAPDTRRNPLNRPVAFINLVQDIDGAPADPAPLRAAWRDYVHQTWPIPEMKAPENHAPLAHRIAQTLPATQRELFLHGCGLGDTETGMRLAMDAIARGAGHRAYLDPRPHLSGVRCPVTLVHGVDDDVIHHSELEALAGGLTHAAGVRSLRTGLYGHSATHGSGSPGPAALARELAVLLEVLSGIVCSASDTHACRP